MQRPLTMLAGLAVAAAIAMPVPSFAAPEHIKVGTLSCDISSGISLIVTSKKTVRCTFSPTHRGRREAYFGTITKYGLDLGATSGGRMIWAVYASTNRWHDALAGHYGGASAEATVGAGVGTNVLVGGSNHTVTLQPISVQGQMGLNLAVGVSGLELQRARH
jgi:hypothetical protein